jgi:hypothetical protein
VINTLSHVASDSRGMYSPPPSHVIYRYAPAESVVHSNASLCGDVHQKDGPLPMSTQGYFPYTLRFVSHSILRQRPIRLAKGWYNPPHQTSKHTHERT